MGAPALPRLRGARLPRLPVRALAALILIAVLLAGAWLWLRDSSLAEVRNVEVVGSTSSEEGAIRAALEEAALDMTTLHVRHAALRSAVAPYDSVAGLRVATDFPHGMRIEVVEHRPVAALDTGGRRVPASGSGLLLRGVQADRDLPVIRTGSLPPGERVDKPRTRAALALAGAAPAPLLRRTEAIWSGEKGLEASLARGPDLIFGDASHARAKWAAAARVLADPDSSGAIYLDLRIPERVAAGGLGPAVDETPTPAPEPNPQP